MMMEVMRIVRLNGSLILRPAATEIAKEMCGMVIDNDDRSACLHGRSRRHFRSGALEKSPQSRYLFDPKLGGVGSLKDFPPRADEECEFTANGRLYLP